jgi:inhibitor of KinA
MKKQVFNEVREMDMRKEILKIELMPLGEGAVLVEFGREIRPEIHQKVKAFSDYLETHSFPGFLEFVAAFSSVTVFYDPFLVNRKEERPFQSVCCILLAMLDVVQTVNEKSPDIVEIPVCYGGEFGPDLEFVAKYHGLEEEKVIELHTQGRYLVYMIGFAPGFPYLGGLSEQIATPRRSSPRLVIPAGSVGIAGAQTGVYPIETPGGWQLIGRTPLQLFQPKNTSLPTLLQAGNMIRFRAISPKEYQSYQREVSVCR